MKKAVLLVLFVFLGITTYAQEKPEIKWYSFEEVIGLTEKDPKMVFVDVYTDWCGWCKKMDKDTFTDSKVIDYINENFYAVKMNAEDKTKKFKFKGKEYTEETMARMMRVTSYPNFVIMDAAMENITQLPGYREPKPFLTSLNSLLENFNP
ncbi:MAG: thioredoxin fold domain-containing protein [Anditalea sp.]